MATKQNKFQRSRHLKTWWRLWWPSWILIGIVLDTFDLEVILLLQCVSTQIAQRCWRRSQKLVFKMVAMAAILDFQSAWFELFFIYTSSCCFIVSFNLIPHVVCKMSKTYFQDGGHLGCSIDLAHFHPEVVLLLRDKFQLKSTEHLGRDVENWFSRWWLWWPSWIFYLLSFSCFVSTRRPDAPHQVSTKLNHTLEEMSKIWIIHNFRIWMYRTHTNAQGSKFDLAVKRSNFNVGPSF